MVFIISETLIIFVLVYIIVKLKAKIEDLQGKIIGLKMQIAFQRYFSNKKKNRIKKKSESEGIVGPSPIEVRIV